jgi:2-polyprenyl-3-methyl-5-hydroxy-6-metoxy-1,4-benzoquinol methylase
MARSVPQASQSRLIDRRNHEVTTDTSEGWDTIAATFMAVRSEVGAQVVRRWAKDGLSPLAAILDLGCGSGVPIGQALVGEGFAIWGIDASPSLVSAYRANLPDMPIRCEPVQDSDFFGRRFAGVVAIGLIFLLAEADQLHVLEAEPLLRRGKAEPIFGRSGQETVTRQPGFSGSPLRLSPLKGSHHVRIPFR